MKEKYEKKRIVMIGPVYPFKTGLAHYVSLLYKRLQINYNVTLISYSMWYPKILYKKPQRDYSDDVLKLNDIQYILNTANPFNWIKVAKYINEQKPKLVLLQWQHPYFTPCYFMLIKMIKNIKILYICHNVFPHERFPMDKWLTKLALKPADYYITHSNSDAEDLKMIVSNPDLRIAVHPVYNFFKQKNISKREARDILGVSQDERIILFFGLVREYKGLKHLLNAMGLLEHRMQVKLFIVGDFGGTREQYEKVIRTNAIEKNVNIIDGYIPACEVEKFFAACDLVVLPYESATQSGVVQIAYGFEKPVIVTNVGGLPDVVENGKTGYVVEAKNPKALSDAIVRYFEEEKAEEFAQNVKGEAYRFSWDRMVEQIESFDF